MGLFGQAKDLYKLQKQAKKIKAELKNIHIEADSNGITVVINGEQEVIDVRIPEEKLNADLKTDLIVAFNKAVKKAQEVAAERMKGMMGEMGLDIPGMTE